MNTVIVTGPQGCGKTLQADALKRHLGCARVVEEWWAGEPLTPGALHLTHEPVDAHEGARVVQFVDLVRAGVVMDWRKARRDAA